MKIGNPADKTPALATVTSQPAAADAAKATASNGTAASAAAASSAASSHVALSSTASTLLAPGGDAVFDAAKVNRITDAIANGTFKINAETIADKLISNAQELLSKVKS